VPALIVAHEIWGLKHMTFQIGMIGSNGFAVVGDTWKHFPARERSWWGYSSEKMILSPSGKSLGVVARNVDISSEAVKAVFEQLEGRSGPKEKHISAIALEVSQNHDVELFVAFTDPHPEMYFFVKEARRGLSNCEMMTSCYQIGDAGNPAYYWLLRNYSINLSVDRLVKVGALAVVTGGKLNPAVVQGLEVATFDQKGLRIWGRDENAALKSEVEEIDRRIGGLVLPPEAVPS
jgi:hypothetical protein